MEYNNFQQPLKVKPGDSVSCPFIMQDNLFKNTPVDQPQTLNGTPVNKLCVPNLSYRGPQQNLLYPGFGYNICDKNNNSVHLNFDRDEKIQKSECYSESTCSKKMDGCNDPYSAP
jgi:hypothetical protein